MTENIDTTIEGRQANTANFESLFVGEDISEAELIGRSNLKGEQEAVPDAQEPKEDETASQSTPPDEKPQEQAGDIEPRPANDEKSTLSSGR